MQEARQLRLFNNVATSSVNQVLKAFRAGALEPGVTVSIGLAQMDPKGSLPSLIARTDSALYKAKQQGRNCLC
ncbi:diguanylate cyclase domain-containing protein [Pseudomonas sp. CC6-YY-74]|uniref:GGDEF domain-containing protein n=1 Tax=Pseudomonas sp. CC6-YY-74 TaxID=1930532 RepID=UPI0009A22ABA|nr:diguanylate cyclase [Pseudomonas sp. CC6-YY-74]